jgi:phosphatidylserine/phosphatidylglycerophosphate/cardiolipin synthase-like enzyme
MRENLEFALELKRLGQRLFVGALILTSAAKSLAASQIWGPYFNHDETSTYTDPYRGILRSGSDLESHILSEIERATTSLDIAVQELRLPQVARAVARKHQAGVRVRLVIENEYNFTIADLDLGRVGSGKDHASKRVQEYIRFVDINGDGHLSSYEISQRDAMGIVKNAQVPLIDDTADGSKGSPLMHHKFVLVDGTRLLVTSANFTMSDVHGDYSSSISRGNANALLIFDDPTLVAQYQKEFDLLWGNKSGSGPRFGVRKPYRGAVRSDIGQGRTLTVQFSPTSKSLGFDASTSGLIDRSLQRAQKSVDMALFVFSEQRFSDTLQKHTQKFPLRIRLLVEPTFAFQWFSETLDMMGLSMKSPSCVGDQDNSPWSRPIRSIGTPRLDNGDFLHHKFAVIDGKTTVFGSQNWSNAANDSNDENLLVIEDERVSQKFAAEFQRLYRDARLGVPQGVLREIKRRESMCPSEDQDRIRQP